MKTQAIIIDDEPICRALLADLLAEICCDIHVVATAEGITDAVQAIEQHRPQLVFLDIHLRDGSGFEVLKQVTYRNFEVVFTTAYDQYALRAFEVAALHYLLKPLDENDLRNALQRYQQQNKNDSVAFQAQQSQLLQSQLPQQLTKIGLPVGNSVAFVQVVDILYLEADAGYTTFYFAEQQQPRIVVSKSLRTYEEMLSASDFCRIHDKYLVNLKHVTRYLRGRGGQVELSNGVLLDVSTRRKEILLSAFNK